MKKSGQIVNSPVISIQEGLELGTVRELVVNPEKKCVEFLLVEKNEEGREGEILAIPFRETVGVGEYAVTIEHQRILLDLSRMNIAGNLLENRVNIIDEKVVTRKGKLLGSITEYMVDPENGSIPMITLVLEDGQTEKELPFESIVSIGRQVVIVTDDAEDLLNSEETTGAEIAEPQTTTAPGPEGDVLLDQMTSGAEISQDEIESGSSVEMFISRQKSFLLGKELKQDLKDGDGNVIAPAGTSITPEIFEQVQEMGRQKVIELTMLTE